jgi:phage repressor protein C with HTH and peptisase S24 domain
MSVAERLSQKMAEMGLTQAELARRVGVSQPTIFKLASAQSTNSVHLHKIARALGTTPEYLLGETDDAQNQMVQSSRTAYRAGPSASDSLSISIPEIDIGYSMGSGLVLQDHAEAKPVPFPREWLRTLIRGSFDQVFIARGEGDSMLPTLLDGDFMLIDTSQNAINAQDRLWCLGYGDLGMIKRVRALPDGGFAIISDNPAVQSFTAYDGEVQVIGRVVWIGRKV